MIGTLLRHIEQQYMQTNIPDFRIGDRVEVHQRILDGPKERIQVFEGDVIARQHDGIRETFTVRRIVQGEGVERIFPLHSPRIAKIVVKKAGKVRRAKLYYLRDRVGKATRIREDKERQAKIDEELRRAAEEAAKAAAEAAAKAAAEGGTSKSAQKKKAKREAQASGNTGAKGKKK
jgi:large subunit ribosomal protein L19